MDEVNMDAMVAEVMNSYHYEHPYPTEAYILCKRWLEGGRDASENYQAFLKLAKRQERKYLNRLYLKKSQDYEDSIDTYTDI